MAGIIFAATTILCLGSAFGAEFPVAEEFGATFDAVAGAARRIEPGKNYIERLPERRRACVVTAYRAFGHFGSTMALVMVSRPLAHCYLTIIARIEELYYKTPDKPGEAIAGRAGDLSTQAYGVFHDIYWSTRQCNEQPAVRCGTAQRVLPYHDYRHLVAAIMDAMAYQVAHDVAEIRDFDAWQKAWDAAERFPK
ncbi:MAG: hypothetical protein ACREEE_11210 [Dongiaceae bacterium]